MDEKQGPAQFNINSDAQAGSYNPGYAAPPEGGYPPSYPGSYPGSYPPPQQAGYATNYGYNQPPSHAPQPMGYSAGAYSNQSTVVVNQPMHQGIIVNNVPDNMGLAIFTTICCCWPLGIVAILRAQESRRALDRGDLVAASTYSAESRRYSMIAIGLGVCSVIIAIIVIVVVVTQNSYYSYTTYG